MKIFQTIQKQYATVGISPSNPSTRDLPFNGRILFGFLLFGCLILLQLMHIFYVASGFLEYVVCVSTTCGTVIVLVCFGAIVFRTAVLFEGIEKIEEVIDKSKAVLL